MRQASSKIIGVVNCDKDIVDILDYVLGEKGYKIVSADLPLIEKQEKDLYAFLKKNSPDVLFWNIPPPYDKNLIYCHKIMSDRLVKGKRLILTTTNEMAIKKLTRDWKVDIIEQPFNLNNVSKLIRGGQKQLH